MFVLDMNQNVCRFHQSLSLFLAEACMFTFYIILRQWHKKMWSQITDNQPKSVNNAIVMEIIKSRLNSPNTEILKQKQEWIKTTITLTKCFFFCFTSWQCCWLSQYIKRKQKSTNDCEWKSRTVSYTYATWNCIVQIVIQVFCFFFLLIFSSGRDQIIDRNHFF